MTDARGLPHQAPIRRAATKGEENVARAWVDWHHWSNPSAAEMEYEHALSILIFSNTVIIGLGWGRR